MSTKTRSGARRRQRRSETAGRALRSEPSEKSIEFAAEVPAAALAAASSEEISASLSATVETPAAEPRNHRELAETILTRCDPVQIGCELLASSSEKGASVRARVFETLVNWQFGKTGAAPANDKPNLRIIWDLPCPPHEREYFGPTEEIGVAGETEPEAEP